MNITNVIHIIIYYIDIMIDYDKHIYNVFFFQHWLTRYTMQLKTTLNGILINQTEYMYLGPILENICLSND